MTPEITDVAFSQSIPLATPGTAYMPPQIVSGALAFTPAAGATRGASCYVRLTADGANQPTFTGFKEWGGSMGWDNRAGMVNQLQFFHDGVDSWFMATQERGAVAAVSSVAMTGPTTGATSTASTNFTVNLYPVGGTFSGSAVVTPNDGGAGGTFNPASVTLTSVLPTATFKYTPNASPGNKVISVTNDRGLVNPAAINYNATGASQAATGVTLSGPASGLVSAASSDFTVGVSPVGGTITGTITITPNDGGAGGTFNPLTVSLTSAAPTATFKYTPSSEGAKSINVANNGGLTNPANLTYTVTASSGSTGGGSGTGGVDPLLRLTALNSTTETDTDAGVTGGPYSYACSATGSFSTRGGVLNKKLPAGVDGYFSLRTVLGADLMMCVHSSEAPAAVESYTLSKYILWATTSYKIFESNTVKTPLVDMVPQANDIMRLRRTGAALVAEVARAADPTNFTTIYSWPAAYAGVLAFQLNVRTMQVDNFSGSGLA